MSGGSGTAGAAAVAAGYGEDLAAIHAAGFTFVARAAAREALQHLAPGSSVVELGSGDGTTAAVLAEAGHTVLGIDSSPELVELARRKAPGASFRVGSFLDEAPPPCDAVLAIGEVLGYRLDRRNRRERLGGVLLRIARSLRPGGFLLMDLAGPGRVPGGRERTWREGEGWAVLVDAQEAGRTLTREIVAFRDTGGGSFRRSREVHELDLHRPSEVLTTLRAAGLTARTLPAGYAGEPLRPGWTAYLARSRA